MTSSKPAARAARGSETRSPYSFRNSLIAFSLRAYPARTASMVALLLLAGAAEGVGLATLLPLLELVAGAGSRSPLARSVENLLQRSGVPLSLETLLALIVVALTIKSLFQWLAMRQVGYTVARVATDLRLMLMRALLHARWRYFTTQPSGHFANAISIEAYRASAAYREACAALAGAIQVAVYLGLAFLIAWPVAVAAVAAGAGFLLGLRGLVRMSLRAGQRQTDRMMSLIAHLVDALHALKPAKAMGRESLLWRRLEQEAKEFNEAQQRQVLATETLRLFQQPVLVLLVAVGLYTLLNTGSQPFSAVLVMIFLFYRLLGVVHRGQASYQAMAAGESAFWSLRRQIQDAELQREGSGGTRKPLPLSSGIELRSVNFLHDGRPILKDVSLFIPAGRLIALTGPSGAGKTTLADLITGLYQPDSGEVLLDGVPMRDLDLAAWRTMIGYVPQEAPLFHDTILHNITMGDDHIGAPAVEAALRAAGAWDFVTARAQGEHAIVGEHGAMLSGGQRQRIALARALVRNPTLLILDEVTAGLDPETEEGVYETLRALRGRMTILFISHRPGIVEVADMVVKVAGGGALLVDAIPARL